MGITRKLEVKIKREMMDTNELIIPKGTPLKVEGACFEFDSPVYFLIGEAMIDGVKENIELWAYVDDFIPAGILAN